KGARVNNAVAVPLKSIAIRMRRLGIAASARFLDANGIRGEHSSSLAAVRTPRQPNACTATRLFSSRSQTPQLDARRHCLSRVVAFEETCVYDTEDIATEEKTTVDVAPWRALRQAAWNPRVDGGEQRRRL